MSDEEGEVKNEEELYRQHKRCWVRCQRREMKRWESLFRRHVSGPVWDSASEEMLRLEYASFMKRQWIRFNKGWWQTYTSDGGTVSDIFMFTRFGDQHVPEFPLALEYRDRNRHRNRHD